MDIEPPPTQMNIEPPPPTTTTFLYTHTHTPPNDAVSSPTSSAIIAIIVISSAIILSASAYILLRFLSRRFNRTTFSPTDDVVSTNHNQNQNDHIDHVISITNPNLDSLPLFTFSSLTGKIAGGDCAVCLSKFERSDLLRLLPLCCHAFHVECIDAWLKSNQTCPLCRSSVNPSDSDIFNNFNNPSNTSNTSNRSNRSNSFRIEIGTVSQRRDPSESDRRTYSLGSYDYVLDDDYGYEIPIESTHRSVVSVSDCTDKDSTVENLAAEVAGSGRRNWLREYVDRVSHSLSSRTVSLRGSGRFFAGSSRRSETVNEFEVSNSRIGEEISELFRWFSGV